MRTLAEQLVPDPPPGMRNRDWIAYYRDDLVEAIGTEFIDRAPRHPGLQKAVPASRKVKGAKKPPEARGGQPAVAELAL